MNRNGAIRIKHPCNEGLCLRGVREVTRRGGGREDAAAAPRAAGAGPDPAGAPGKAGSHVPILHLCPEQPAPGQGNPWICKQQCKASSEAGEEKPQLGFLARRLVIAPLSPNIHLPTSSQAFLGVPPPLTAPLLFILHAR